MKSSHHFNLEKRLNIFQVKNGPAPKEESSAAKLDQTIALASSNLAEFIFLEVQNF